MPEPARIVPIPCPFGKAGMIVYCYYIDAPEPAIIDVGVTGSPAGCIEPALRQAGFRLSDVKWILASHGHWDHIGGAQTAKDRAASDAQIAIHAADVPLLRSRQAHLDGYQGVRFQFVDDPAGFRDHGAMIFENLSGELGADRELKDGDRIDLGGGVVLTTVHTPGHSAGSVTFYYDGPGFAFTGDSVQSMGADGRFPLIEHPAEYRSSMRRLLDDVRPTRMHLGHGYGRPGGGHFQPIIEGGTVAEMLRESIDVEAGFAAQAERVGSTAGRERDPAIFAHVAESLGMDASKPETWPNSLFITMASYLRQRGDGAADGDHHHDGHHGDGHDRHGDGHRHV
jgi:hydroxyacylglutathione hydrolase